MKAQTPIILVVFLTIVLAVISLRWTLTIFHLLILIVLIVLALQASTVWTLFFVIDTAQRRTEKRIEKHRKDASRHEWIQENALDKIDAATERISSLGLINDKRYGYCSHQSGVKHSHRSLLACQSSALSPRDKSIPDVIFNHTNDHLPRVLFITSNGGGLGHITRCLAIAEASDQLFHSTVITLSAAYREIVGDFPYLAHFPSIDHSQYPREWWNHVFSEVLTHVISTNNIDAVVFDGIGIYRGITHACIATQTPLIWCKRGLWKKHSSASSKDSTHRAVDSIIVPGEAFDSEEKSDDKTRRIPPIMLRADQGFEKETAQKKLGLEPGQKYCLLQLGTTEIEGINNLTKYLTAEINNAQKGFIPVVLHSPLSQTSVPSGCISLPTTYPFNQYLSAFDCAVSAAGYNSVLEIVQRGLPTLFIPNPRTPTDDQCKRAQLLVKRHACLSAHTAETIDVAVEKLLDERWQNHTRQILSSFHYPSGAHQAGEFIRQRIDIRHHDPLVLTTSRQLSSTHLLRTIHHG